METKGGKLAQSLLSFLYLSEKLEHRVTEYALPIPAIFCWMELVKNAR
jgi:hypothetical protein